MGEIVLRDSQEKVAKYTGGYMGVSAVPGSGKTTTLCALGVRLIKDRIKSGQRILIVTYQNTAVANIQSRIMDMLDKESLLPTGYDVRTLHSLSRGILKENPGLIGLDNRFEVLDENTVARILDNSVDLWCRTNVGRYEAIQRQSNIRSPKKLRGIIRNVGRGVIDSAKDNLLGQDQLIEILADSPVQDDTSFLQIGAEIYQSYQNEIESRGAVDFNDLVRYSVQLLRDHPDILDRYRERWPFILEDEAQDSVPLQQELLINLAGKDGNWVRVGDPNQAIMSTFTSAEPGYLMQFLEREDVDVKPLLKAGRSASPVMELANDLVKRVSESHPIERVRKLSFRQQYIEPTLDGDPQPNPPKNESKVSFQAYPLGSQEIASACDKLLKWVNHYKGQGYTYAILTPNNNQGLEVIQALKARNVAHVEMLKTSTVSKKTAKGLSDILELLAFPDGKPSRQNVRGSSLTTLLNSAYKFIESLKESADANVVEMEDLRVFQNMELESFLYPSPVQKKYLNLDSESLERFRGLLRKWFDALLLPVDQLILTITDDILKNERAEVGRRIARLVKGWSEDDPHLSMPELSNVLLAALTSNRVRLEDEQSEIEPEEDVASVSTLHKSKGLEWDFVFVLHATSRRFHYSYDDYFIGDYPDLGGYPSSIAKAEMLELLGDESSLSDHSDPKADVVAEDMRLLYVAITRARRFLSVSWNEKDDGRDYEVKPSKIVLELASSLSGK